MLEGTSGRHVIARSKIETIRYSDDDRSARAETAFASRVAGCRDAARFRRWARPL